jgi:hypothetical protein
VEAVATAAGMAADLALVEHQRQSISQQPNHGQHYQGRALMNGGMFQVAVGGNGLKHFGIDAPPAAAELMDEQRGDRAKSEIRGLEVGALVRHDALAFP